MTTLPERIVEIQIIQFLIYVNLRKNFGLDAKWLTNKVNSGKDSLCGSELTFGTAKKYKLAIQNELKILIRIITRFLQ